MKGVICDKAGAPFHVVDNLEKPEPAADQVLVKSIYTAINPVDAYMSGMGLLVTAWPFVLGCDAGGVVVKAGDKASTPLGPLKVGDEVCGCTRLGVPGYSTCQEYFLMDGFVTIPKPKNISIQDAATIGVGTETACLGIFNGLDIPLLDAKKLPAPKDEWVLVLGGASSVGKYGVQILKACGFKVAASCSAKSAALVKKIGADAVLDYKKSPEDQVKDIMSVTEGKCHRIFDAVAMNDSLARGVFKELGEGPKFFATTNDWSNITHFEGGKTYNIRLGEVGRPEGTALNKDLESYIPIIVQLIEDGKMVPNDYEIVGKGGFEDVIEAFGYQQKGAGGSNKVLVKIQDN